eukprot:gb/GFBE01033660.1/.p1 GENE.gb/GFBE01033660.1/~~gb/GFBE01033660.1/.p1  ORF type:complete len:394 (+),score=104.44 gb/GFBE01033660.1/:1-1182(+)
MRSALACGMRRFGPSSVALNRQAPLLVPCVAQRAFGSAKDLADEVEAVVAGGKSIGRSSELYLKISEELERLRTGNDKILAEVAACDTARLKLVDETDQAIDEIRKGHASSAEQMAGSLSEMENLSRQIAELRSRQISNYMDIGALKRQRVVIQKSEEAMSLANQVYDALEKEEHIPEDGPLAVEMSKVTLKLRKEFDEFSKSLSATKKTLDNVVSRLRSIELSLRVRRGKADHETDALRTTLLAALFEARRKNAQLTRYRVQQALNVKLVAVLERAKQSLLRNAQIQALIDSGNKDHMETETKVLLRDLEVTQKTARDLEATKASRMKEVSEVTAKLRAMDHVVTPETGALRERLVEALREEEFCMARLAVVRKVQAQDVKFLARIGKALKA